jgi:hypothetical protein
MYIFEFVDHEYMDYTSTHSSLSNNMALSAAVVAAGPIDASRWTHHRVSMVSNTSVYFKNAES